MSTDQPSPGASTADPANSPPPLQPPGIKQTFRDAWRVIVELWWRFFDWLAVVSWKTLLIVYALCLIPAAMLNRPNPYFLFIFVSAIVKVVAGGKRRAELTARQAT